MANVAIQVYLTAAVMNLEQLAALLGDCSVLWFEPFVREVTARVCEHHRAFDCLKPPGLGLFTAMKGTTGV